MRKVSGFTWNQLKADRKKLFDKKVALKIRKGESVETRIYQPFNIEGADDASSDN